MKSAKLVGPAVITTAVSVGFGGAVLACNGAETVLEAISALPVPPNLSFSIAASFAGRNDWKLAEAEWMWP